MNAGTRLHKIKSPGDIFILYLLKHEKFSTVSSDRYPLYFTEFRVPMSTSTYIICWGVAKISTGPFRPGWQSPRTGLAPSSPRPVLTCTVLNTRARTLCKCVFEKLLKGITEYRIRFHEHWWHSWQVSIAPRAVIFVGSIIGQAVPRYDMT